MITRRVFLKGALAGAVGAGAHPRLLEAATPSPANRIRVGSCRVTLEQARQAGLDGVEIEVGKAAAQLRIADPAVHQQYKEQIRFLQDRIACLHFKDGPNYLGEGGIKFEPIASAINAIDYAGWIVMETANPSKDAVADARRNAAFIRKLFGLL